jgi:hypothetical protein
MPTLTTKSESYKALIKLEKRHRFFEKETNLDFKPEPLFPEWWQILLDADNGMLFEPLLAAEASEVMIRSHNPNIVLLGDINLHQTAVLHPETIQPIKVLERPLPELMEIVDEKNFRCYALGRLFCLALASDFIQESRMRTETALLFSYLTTVEKEVFKALKQRDINRLDELQDLVLSHSPHRLYSYWWNIFFDTHLYALT